MGRGAKIFFVSAFLSACVFGLVAFVIISAVVDGSKAPTLLIVNVDASGKEISCVKVDGKSVSASTSDVEADRKITLDTDDVHRICEVCGVEYRDVSNSQNAEYLANKIIDRLKQDGGEELILSLIAELDTDLTGSDIAKWKKSVSK